MPESLWDYLMRITRTAPGAEIARVVGMDAGTVSRWKTGKSRPSMEAAVAIARKWNRPPVEVLIAAGHLDISDAGPGVVEVGRSVDELSDDDLLSAIERRMKEIRHALHQTAAAGTPGKAREVKEASGGRERDDDPLTAAELAAFGDEPEDGEHGADLGDGPGLRRGDGEQDTDPPTQVS